MPGAAIRRRRRTAERLPNRITEPGPKKPPGSAASRQPSTEEINMADPADTLLQKERVMTEAGEDELFEAQLLHALWDTPRTAAPMRGVPSRGRGDYRDQPGFLAPWRVGGGGNVGCAGRRKPSAAAGQAASAQGGFFRAASTSAPRGCSRWVPRRDPRLAEAHRREECGQLFAAVPRCWLVHARRSCRSPTRTPSCRATTSCAAPLTQHPRATMILVTGYDGFGRGTVFLSTAPQH